MKVRIAIAAILATASVTALAAETAKQAPQLMTAAEMEKVVAGARMGPGDGTGYAPKLYLGSNGKGGGTGVCKTL